MGIEPQEELSSGRSPEELAFLVSRSAEAGTLDVQTADPADPHAAVLRPHRRGRDDAAGADAGAAPGRHRRGPRRAGARTGHSRFPVIDEDVDDVVGVVHVKRAVAVPRERRDEVPVAA